MGYTFWHDGLLIGSSAMDHPTRNPGQRAGAFDPTPHGVRIFPSLTGTLTAMLALGRELEAAGIATDRASPEELEAAMLASPAGRKMLEVGKALSEVEVRNPGGRALRFSSIAFTDIDELRRLGKSRGGRGRASRAEAPPGAPRYLVSATFLEHEPWFGPPILGLSPLPSIRMLDS